MNLPNNVEAEREFLSVLLNRPALIRQYEGIVRDVDFYRHANSQIYSCLLRLSADGNPVTLQAVVEDLRKRGTLHSIGGIAELTAIQGITNNQFGISDKELAQSHAGIILDCSRQRDGIRAYMTAAQRVESGEDLESVAAMVNAMIENAAHGVSDNIMDACKLTAQWKEWFAETKTKGKCPGIGSGFPYLDSLTGGWQESSLVILGARPNMGKTALALNFATQACKDGKSVLIFSLEMTSRQLISRIVAAEGNIDANHTKIPALMSEGEEQISKRVLEKVDGWKLHIDDTPALPVSQIFARARRMQNSKGLDMVVIDHLNYIGSDGKSENRTNEVRKITAALKGMAKELNIPVICLCQLSRALESRPNKKPILADLRESGTIEQDADIVLFLYREAYYTKDAGDKSANLEVAKIRDGLLGNVALRFEGVHQKFTQDEFAGACGKSLLMEDIPA